MNKKKGQRDKGTKGQRERGREGQRERENMGSRQISADRKNFTKIIMRWNKTYCKQSSLLHYSNYLYFCYFVPFFKHLCDKN